MRHLVLPFLPPPTGPAPGAAAPAQFRFRGKATRLLPSRLGCAVERSPLFCLGLVSERLFCSLFSGGGEGGESRGVGESGER